MRLSLRYKSMWNKEEEGGRRKEEYGSIYDLPDQQISKEKI